MGLRDVYYYSIAFAMMAGVIIAYLLNLDIDQKPNGRICVRSGFSDNFSKAKRILVILG
ncbi:hypothetical protein [Methanosarcina sp.]|uniref:hypothetical protein n=1 Tax=Methanosarcina sp. TaxID=2213 RepID=UPI0029899B86|nr:hypothetical protein [Methanosarcina sp.]MDW5549211.1 hypothetical protein [Methanosarcina sp.]MDW5553083.1 hypothetical protein [Methanosarcina sp.]MDW5559391.1 hypothetical protein [Methanosarcina sp.]